MSTEIKDNDVSFYTALLAKILVDGFVESLVV